MISFQIDLDFSEIVISFNLNEIIFDYYLEGREIIYHQKIHIDKDNYEYIKKICMDSDERNSSINVDTSKSGKNLDSTIEKYDKMSAILLKTSKIKDLVNVDFFIYDSEDRAYRKNIGNLQFTLSDIKNMKKIFKGGKKSPVRKLPVRKLPVKKSPAKKSPAKKAPAKKAPAKKAPAKKAPAKKAPVKKAPVKKAPVKKSPAKKSPAKK
jgi:hypothetical protein